jgi:hypothetical protein
VDLGQRTEVLGPTAEDVKAAVKAAVDEFLTHELGRDQLTSEVICPMIVVEGEGDQVKISMRADKSFQLSLKRYLQEKFPGLHVHITD